MSRKNKSNFGAGATGSISFPRASAPTPVSSSDVGPMRIAPPKSTSTLKYAQAHIAHKAELARLAALAAAHKVKTLPQSSSEHAGSLVTAVSPAVKKAVALVPQSASEYAGAPVTSVTPAVKEAVAMVPSQSVTDAARHASAMVTPKSGGGGGGGVAWSPDTSGQPAAVYEETPDPQGEAKAAPQQADTEGEPVMAWTPPDSRTAMVKVSAPLPVLATAEPAKGFFARIWEFFFGAKKVPVQKSLPPQLPAAKVAGELEDASEALVKRARYGDQNAMAILDLVGKNAKKGIPAAMKARDLIASYIRRNPVDKINGELTVKHGDLTITHTPTQAQINGEHSVRRAATHIANGPTVTHDRVKQTLSTFCSEAEKGAFLHGMRYPQRMTPSQYGSKVELAHRAGKALALAGKIQNVRKPGSYITAFDPLVGWELGE